MAVEKFAPWVNKIYLITDDQVPSWLEKFGKVVVIDHADYIPQRYLPTFNSNAIELNLGRIKNLSDHFVLFNDDTFLNADVQPSDFFLHGRPVDVYAESPIIATPGSIANTMVNNMTLINGNFSKKAFYQKNFSKVFNPKVGKKLIRTLALLPSTNFSGIWNSHLPVAYLKDTYLELGQRFRSQIDATSQHKFRTNDDYSHWLMRYWQLVSGQYELPKTKLGKVYNLGSSISKELSQDILLGKHKMICLNDNDDVENFLEMKRELQDLYRKKFTPLEEEKNE